MGQGTTSLSGPVRREVQFRSQLDFLLMESSCFLSLSSGTPLLSLALMITYRIT